MAERIRNLQPGEASYSNSLKRPTSVLIQKFLSNGSMDFERSTTEAFD